MVVAMAALVLVLDLAWVTYYVKLVWLILAGVIAEASMLSRTTQLMRR
jgi:hypothetical protein